MVLITLLKNKYVQILAVAMAALVFGFTSGYSYKADKVELERLQQFEVLVNKLDSVKQFSETESTRVNNRLVGLRSKLDTITLKAKEVPLSSVPCTPSDEFSKLWREVDEETINSN